MILGGQHTPFWGGQHAPFWGGQYERFFQSDIGEYNIVHDYLLLILNEFQYLKIGFFILSQL